MLIGGRTSQSMTSQSGLSITLKTSLNLQELNRFRKEYDLTVDFQCNEGEAVVYTHYIGQMIHTELNFCRVMSHKILKIRFSKPYLEITT